MKTSKPVSIDEYLAGFSQDVQKLLQEIRKIVHDVSPDVIETIKYDMPTFMLENENMIHFAAFKNHIGIYPVPAGDENFDNELSSYKTGKGSVQIPLSESLPKDLIIKIVQFNVVRVRGKITARQKKFSGA